MATYDPDFVRWGLTELFDGVFGLSNPWIGRTSIQANEVAQTEFVQIGESYPVRGYNVVENDEVIAYTLQEELSKLAAKEAAEGEPQSSKEDPTEASVLVQDWFGRNYPPLQTDAWQGNNNWRESLDYDLDQNNHNGSDQDGEGDEDGVPRFSEDSSVLDEEIRKRLMNMNSIPHVPRINGEIPTVDDATADRQRLLNRLKFCGLSERKMDGDGNCQFRAFSDQLYRTSDHHQNVREKVVEQLKLHPDLYEGYVPMKYSEYLDKMAKSGEWGDHVTLQAAADIFGVRICLLTSYRDTCFVEILPKQPRSKRAIFLSFWAEVHYNSIYPEEDIHSSFGLKKKKSHWSKLFKGKW